MWAPCGAVWLLVLVLNTVLAVDRSMDYGLALELDTSATYLHIYTWPNVKDYRLIPKIEPLQMHESIVYRCVSSCLAPLFPLLIAHTAYGSCVASRNQYGMRSITVETLQVEGFIELTFWLIM